MGCDMKEKSVAGHVLAFLFAFGATLLCIMFFSTYTIVAVGIILVILWAVGYGFAAVLGLVLGAVVFLVGWVPNFIGTLTNPFGWSAPWTVI